MPKRSFFDLRNSRKRQSISRETCGSTRKRQGKRRETCGSTRKRQSISRETCGSTRKRQSISRGTCGSTRKRQGKRRETCGTPADTKAFPVVLAPVVQAFPKALWPLQRSIQAILQGLGASFFRSSSRCKDFWKERSAVEGIRFAPIDRLEAIRACDLYPKCRSDPATHFRPQ